VGDREQECFADGLTEEMISQLGQLNPKRLGVIARTSAIQYKATKEIHQRNCRGVARRLCAGRERPVRWPALAHYRPVDRSAGPNPSMVGNVMTTICERFSMSKEM